MLHLFSNKPLVVILVVLAGLQQPFINGVLQSIVAAVIVAWAAYLWRVPIRRIIETQTTSIRAPLQLGVAPLIVAKSRDVGIWERYGLNMDLDFRYAGKKTLEDLYLPNTQIDLAVASDVALCLFLGPRPHPEEELRVIPFVRIKDHLKIVVRHNQHGLEYTDVDQLRAKRIGYHPESVHDDFLHQLNIFDEKFLVSIESALDCYRCLISKQVDAVVLWEPHYYAFTKFPGVGIVNDAQNDPYEWFLCLVARKSYLMENEHIAPKILSATRDAAAYCHTQKNHERLINDCASFLNTEFTGLDRDGLDDLLKRGQHVFGVDNLLTPFIGRLQSLITKGGSIAAGASALTHSFWKGLNAHDA